MKIVFATRFRHKTIKNGVECIGSTTTLTMFQPSPRLTESRGDQWKQGANNEIMQGRLSLGLIKRTAKIKQERL